MHPKNFRVFCHFLQRSNHTIFFATIIAQKCDSFVLISFTKFASLVVDLCAARRAIGFINQGAVSIVLCLSVLLYMQTKTHPHPATVH